MTTPGWRAGLGVVASTSLLVAGCSAPSGPIAGQSQSTASPASVSAATPAVAKNAERAIADVPWAQVGSGWMLAIWNPVAPRMPGDGSAPDRPGPENGSTVLYLVSPAGDRYSIADVAQDEGAKSLVDWSGDGSHALVAPQYGADGDATSIDLHTGARTPVPRQGSLEYTRPSGKALLESTSSTGNKPGTLKRIDLAGKDQFVYPTVDLGGAGQFSGAYIESPDGTQLVLGTANLGNKIVPRTDNSLVVMGNNGSIIRTLPAPMPQATCAPVRWWSAGVILTHCTAERGSAQQLWKVPLDGGKATAVTAVNPARYDNPQFEGNLGNDNAFELPSGTFLPTAGPCGSTFVSRLTPDGGTRRVHIPGVSDSVGLIGTSGDNLVLVGRVRCGGGNSLIAYDPAANSPTVLLGPPVTAGGGVESVRVYPSEK